MANLTRFPAVRIVMHHIRLAAITQEKCLTSKPNILGQIGLTVNVQYYKSFLDYFN